MDGNSPNNALFNSLSISRLVILLGLGGLLLLTVVQREIFAQSIWKITHWSSIVSLSGDPQFLYEAGSYYMDAASADRYSLEDAENMLQRAMQKDPYRPHGFHQLARVAFLKSDFDGALAYINAELELNPSPSPSSYYIRALIKGYMDDFAGSAADYEMYLKEDPRNWAAINDYAWVLIKEGRLREALIALDWGLLHHSGNPWLLNSKATALFELGRVEHAKEVIELASLSVADVTEELWMQAYPGNDPLIAKEGVETFKKSVEENMHTILLALEAREKNVQ